ncbi:Ig-like domain-containing protein [Bacteroidota bacterium]
MRKIFTLLMISLFSVGVFGQQPTGVIKKASVAPIIGGEIDEVWAESNVYNIDQPYQTELPTLGESGESTWQALWTDDGIFLLLKVTDDAFYPNYAVDPAGNSWEYDKPEIYWDCNFELADGQGASAGNGSGHHQVAPPFVDGSNDGTLRFADDENEGDPGVEYAFVVTEPNYTAEYFFPFSYLTDLDGVEVDRTANIGFDVTLIDRDPGDAARKRAVWANIGGITESWSNMDEIGIVTLDGAEPTKLITDLTITGGDITVNNGTLQMTAEILPADATNQFLSWTVESVTGKAKVSSTGLVTGIVDGEVTIKAATKDGSFLNEEATVNISNQIVVLEEINLVRNGNFSNLNAEAFPLEWTGGSGENPGYVTDGYMVLDPNPGGANPWDFTFVQQGFGCNTTDMYTFSFVAWADATRTFNVDFEDPSNDYNRYGTSTHEYSAGESDWTFDVTTEPTKYVFDVVFNEKLDNTTESMQFMLGLSDTIVYLDSVLLINDNDLVLLTQYTPVSSIELSAAGDVTQVDEGTTIQMSASVLPADADYPDVAWSVINQTGYATVDETGLVSADTIGLVTIVATSTDDSNVSGSYDLAIVTPGTSVEQHTLNTLKVYPNPAVDELNIVLENGGVKTVEIFNSVGMRMHALVVEDDIVSVDISEYPSGMYFVRSGDRVAKFIK